MVAELAVAHASIFAAVAESTLPEEVWMPQTPVPPKSSQVSPFPHVFPDLDLRITSHLTSILVLAKGSWMFLSPPLLEMPAYCDERSELHEDRCQRVRIG